MLTFSADQFRQMEALEVQRFERAMVDHACSFTPVLAQVLGRDGMREAVRARMRLAKAIGLTKRGPIRQVVEVGFLLGAGYVSDPQYPWARAAYDGITPETEMARADFLHQDVKDCLKATAGPENTLVWDALGRLAPWAARIEVPQGTGLAGWMADQLAEIYPEKTAYLGPDRTREMAEAGIALADRHGLKIPRARALMTCLIVCFGHRCYQDPAYPWIGRTLSDPRITSPEKRAERLERKALTWMRHTLRRAGAA